MDQFATGWLETLFGGEVPADVKAVPAPFQELLRPYLSDMQAQQKRAASTLYKHGRSLVAFFVWLGSHAPQVLPDTISPEHIARYLEHYQTDGMVHPRSPVRAGHRKAVRTMYSKIVVLRAFFAWAQRHRHCRDNPVTPFHVDWGPRQVHPLPEERVAELLRIWTDPSTDPRTASVALLCLVYGLTTSRIAALPLNAVNLTTSTFHGLVVPVPIPPWLHPVLERYLTWRQELLDDRLCDRFVVTKQPDNLPDRSLIHRILQPYDVNVRQLRDTAIAQTIQLGHLKLLTVFGITSEMRRYDAISRLAQNTRKVDPKPNLW